MPSSISFASIVPPDFASSSSLEIEASSSLEIEASLTFYLIENSPKFSIFY